MALTNVNNWITEHIHMLSFAHVSSLREAIKADIKEARPTVRAKRPVQQRKADICPRCEDSGLVPDDRNSYGVRTCPKCRGKRSTVA